MLTITALQRIHQLAVEHRARLAQAYTQAEAPVFKRALAAQAQDDLAFLREAYRKVRSQGYERACVRPTLNRLQFDAVVTTDDAGVPLAEPEVYSARGPLSGFGGAQERTISDSLHAFDVAMGHDDLGVVLPGEEDTPLDKLMQGWEEPGDLGDLVAWNAYQQQRLEGLARLAKVQLTERTASFRCDLPFARSYVLDGVSTGVNKAGRRWVRLHSHDTRNEVMASSDLTAYFDDAAWHARQHSIEQVREVGAEQDFKAGPELDAPQPVNGPGMLPEETDPDRDVDPVVTRSLDRMWDSLSEGTLLAQPNINVTILHGLDENEWLTSRELHRPHTA